MAITPPVQEEKGQAFDNKNKLIRQWRLTKKGLYRSTENK